MMSPSDRARIDAKLEALYKKLVPHVDTRSELYGYALSLDETLFLRFAILAVMNANDEHPKHSNEYCLENAIKYADMLPRVKIEEE